MKRDSLLRLPPALAVPASRSDARSGARYVMGIDGGATKTLAAVFDLDERAAHIAEGGPSNEDAVGDGTAVETLLDIADQALQQAGIARSELALTVIAVAGTDTDGIARKVQAARSDDWIVVNDVVGAWAAATGARPGVGAISGTGSNVFGVGPSGQPWQVGGWGHLLGDQGSGYWIGNSSIRAALADRDGSGPPTALSAAVVEFFDVPSVEALAALLYAKPLSKREIAAFAVVACQVAQGGDPVARDLYRHGAAELAAQILVVIERTGLGAGADDASATGERGAAGEGEGEGDFPVGLIGSVFRAGPIFVDPIAAAVHEVAPRARVAVAEMTPVGGSLQLAARACGRGDAIGQDELRGAIDAALAAGATTRRRSSPGES